MRFSQLNANGDQILFLDNNKTVKIYSIIEKKWVYSYVVTLIRSVKVLIIKKLTFKMFNFFKRQKIKSASFTLWPNILAFVCEEGIIYLINIYADEIFQEINIFPLQANTVIFFPNPKGK